MSMLQQDSITFRKCLKAIKQIDGVREYLMACDEEGMTSGQAAVEIAQCIAEGEGVLDSDTIEDLQLVVGVNYGSEYGVRKFLRDLVDLPDLLDGCRAAPPMPYEFESCVNRLIDLYEFKLANMLGEKVWHGKGRSKTLEGKYADLTTEEEETVLKMFKSWDANNDEQIDLQEAHAKFGSKGVNFISDCDTLEKDGKVSIEELKQFFKKLKGNLKEEQFASCLNGLASL